MTTLDVMSSKKKPQPSAEETAAKELGLSLTGPDGLLKQHRIGSRYLDDPT